MAIKVLDSERSAEPGYRRRFERETNAAQRVEPFCTAKVLEANVPGNHEAVWFDLART